jgi:hypothetical protein
VLQMKRSSRWATARSSTRWTRRRDSLRERAKQGSRRALQPGSAGRQAMHQARHEIAMRQAMTLAVIKAMLLRGPAALRCIRHRGARQPRRP